MDTGGIVVIALCMLMCTFIAFVALVLDHEKKKARRGAEPPPPPPPTASRTSFLAGFSFMSGLIAIFMVTASGIMMAGISMCEITGIQESVHASVDLAARIVLYVSLLPAVGAVALALAARGSINESCDALRGRSLYRTGLFLSILSGVLVFNAKVVNPAHWITRGGHGGAGGPGGMLFSRSSKSDPNRGYLGVEHDPEAGNDGIRILRVLPGTPAEIAGLKPGDHLLEIDKVRIAAGESIAGRIGSLAPGTKVELSVRRGEDIIAMSAVLTLPFAALREMLEDASFDNERMAILRAAASDRRFTAAELKGVCETFSFDESREEAAKLALPRLVDPQNAYQILATFSFSSGKENVGRKIEEVLKSRK